MPTETELQRFTPGSVVAAQSVDGSYLTFFVFDHYSPEHFLCSTLGSIARFTPKEESGKVWEKVYDQFSATFDLCRNVTDGEMAEYVQFMQSQKKEEPKKEKNPVDFQKNFMIAAAEMEKTGGSFVKCLGAAYYRADRNNAIKLVSAFYEYFNEYYVRGLKRAEREGVIAEDFI